MRARITTLQGHVIEVPVDPRLLVNMEVGMVGKVRVPERGRVTTKVIARDDYSIELEEIEPIAEQDFTAEDPEPIELEDGDRMPLLCQTWVLGDYQLGDGGARVVLFRMNAMLGTGPDDPESFPLSVTMTMQSRSEVTALIDQLVRYRDIVFPSSQAPPESGR